jgi:hypothetical protein
MNYIALLVFICWGIIVSIINQGFCESNIFFIEKANKVGLTFQQINGSKVKEYIVEAKGAGVAVADVNEDGWDDIYFINGAYLTNANQNEIPQNQLFLNKQDGTFYDYTKESGLGDTGFGTAGYFADVDRDGDLDCYLTNFGPNQLYINNGKCEFTKIPNAGGAQNTGWSTGAAFADINDDGFLDLYVGQYANFTKEIADKMGKVAPYFGEMAFIGPAGYQPAKDNLFINNGDGTFRDETEKRGINQLSNGRAFTVHFTDLDNDADLDIYVANDTTGNHLYENTGKGYFSDVSLLAGVSLSENGDKQGGMGVAIQDIDQDMDLDIAVANYQGEYNILYRNEGDLLFTDVTFVTGMGKGSIPKVSFGMLVEDFNNDTWLDMFISAGHVYPIADRLKFLHGYPQENLFYLNTGEGHFQNISTQIGHVASLKGVSRGCATADFDHDGDLDIIINNLDDKPFYFENKSQCGNWLQVLVQDENGMPAFGAQVIATIGKQKLLSELYSGSSFLSQNSAVLHYGLGKNEEVDVLEIRWPDGKTLKKSKNQANKRIIIKKTQTE